MTLLPASLTHSPIITRSQTPEDASKSKDLDRVRLAVLDCPRARSVGLLAAHRRRPFVRSLVGQSTQQLALGIAGRKTDVLIAAQGRTHVGQRVANSSDRHKGILLSPPPHGVTAALVQPTDHAKIDPAQNRYALSLCSPLPDPSSDAPEDDCPSGTRLCLRTFTSRPGLEDRVLSVVPIITNDADAVPSQKGDTDTAEEWIFEMGGGNYNGVDQRVKIDFKCDKGAKEVRATAQVPDLGVKLIGLPARPPADSALGR